MNVPAGFDTTVGTLKDVAGGLRETRLIYIKYRIRIGNMMTSGSFYAAHKCWKIS